MASDTETLGDADGLMLQHQHILLLHQRRQARGLPGLGIAGSGIGLQVQIYIFYRSHVKLMTNAIQSLSDYQNGLVFKW